jgi:imidazolonepropionase-like amidohydrolase
MPGMIDPHWHRLFAAVPLNVLTSGDPGFMFAASTAEAGRTLLRGFTPVRDMGGPVFSFKQAIDTGVIPGPRICARAEQHSALRDTPIFGSGRNSRSDLCANMARTHIDKRSRLVSAAVGLAYQKYAGIGRSRMPIARARRIETSP